MKKPPVHILAAPDAAGSTADSIMDSQTAQKVREKRFAEHFLELLGESEMLNAIEPSERPDFLLDSESKLGLEVVELFRDPDGTDIAPQAQEGGWNSVANGCAREWSTRDLPHVEVWLGFHSAYHVSKRRLRDIVTITTDLAEEHLPLKGGEARADSVSLPYERFPKELAYMRVSRLVDYTRSYWHVDGPGIWVEELSRDKLQRTLQSKNKSVSDYRRRVSDVWLLAVVHGWRNSSIMDVPAALVAEPYTFDFDRVFLLDTFRERVLELHQESDP